MARPATEITIRENPVPRSAPLDTGRWFVTGLTERGKREPITVRSMGDYEKKLGARSGGATLYDAAETFFREGGNELIVSRVQNTDAVEASANLLDGSAGVSLVATAKQGAGTYGNALNVVVAAGGTAGTFVVSVTDDVLGTLETSPDLADNEAAVAWSDGASNYVTLTLGASASDPVPASYNLTGGTAGTAAVEGDWTAALARLPKDLGPGQVSAPGRTTAAAHQALLDHAAASNRVALLDAVDSTTAGTVQASGSALRTHANARHGMAFGPWVRVPGLTAGTVRTVPPSALVAGLIGRNDGGGMSPNAPAAGVNGIARFALDVTATFTDAERTDLYEDGGVNVIRLRFGQVQVYGFRTLVDPTTLPGWLNAGNVRLLMAIAAEGDAIAETFVLREIDGMGHLQAEYAGALIGMLSRWYAKGSLYGATAEEAFVVDTGPAVNTPESIAANELRAVIAVRMSPMAELVALEIVKVGVTQNVA